MTAEINRDIQRKRLLYRATHRGTKEADAIVGGFVKANIEILDGAQLDALEDLLNRPDADIMDWLRGRRPMPVDQTWHLMQLLKAYQQRLLTD